MCLKCWSPELGYHSFSCGISLSRAFVYYCWFNIPSNIQMIRTLGGHNTLFQTIVGPALHLDFHHITVLKKPWLFVFHQFIFYSERDCKHITVKIKNSLYSIYRHRKAFDELQKTIIWECLNKRSNLISDQIHVQKKMKMNNKEKCDKRYLLQKNR